MRLKFTAKERELIQEVIPADSGITATLEKAKAKNGRFEVTISPESLDDLINEVSAEANHAESPKKEKEYDAFCERLERIQEENDGI
jgi:hypothetical protein